MKVGQALALDSMTWCRGDAYSSRIYQRNALDTNRETRQTHLCEA